MLVKLAPANEPIYSLTNMAKMQQKITLYELIEADSNDTKCSTKSWVAGDLKHHDHVTTM